MSSISRRNLEAHLMALEASARAGFACAFSTSEEYETAQIAERRVQSRYHQRRGRWPAVMFIGCVMMVTATVLLLN